MLKFVYPYGRKRRLLWSQNSGVQILLNTHDEMGRFSRGRRSKWIDSIDVHVLPDCFELIHVTLFVCGLGSDICFLFLLIIYILMSSDPVTYSRVDFLECISFSRLPTTSSRLLSRALAEVFRSLCFLPSKCLLFGRFVSSLSLPKMCSHCAVHNGRCAWHVQRRLYY